MFLTIHSNPYPLSVWPNNSSKQETHKQSVRLRAASLLHETPRRKTQRRTYAVGGRERASVTRKAASNRVALLAATRSRSKSRARVHLFYVFLNSLPFSDNLQLLWVVCNSNNEAIQILFTWHILRAFISFGIFSKPQCLLQANLLDQEFRIW